MRDRDSEAVARLQKFTLERRHALKRRQQDVADLAGTSLAWIGMLESGKLRALPRKDTIVKLAKGLMLPTEQQGLLFQFMELVLAGTIADQVAEGVALGSISAMDVIQQAVAGTLEPQPPAAQKREAASIFHDFEDRSYQFGQLLGLVKDVFVNPYDAVLVEAFLRRVYENAPVEMAEPLSHGSPRRRSTKQGG